MTAEPILILQEKGSKDAFNKKMEMADVGFTTMSCLDDLVLSTTSSVGLQLIKVLNFLMLVGESVADRLFVNSSKHHLALSGGSS